MSCLPPEPHETVSETALLLEIIEGGDLAQVRVAIENIPQDRRLVTLLTRSKRPERKLRTPLIAAAATADLGIFVFVLEACKAALANSDASKVERKEIALHQLLGVSDIMGTTLLMQAAGCGAVGVFQALEFEILGLRPANQLRKLLSEVDMLGRTFIMYAAGAGFDVKQADEELNVAGEPVVQPTPHRMVHPGTIDPQELEAEIDATEDASVDPWVPMVKIVTSFAKKIMWRPEYQKLVKVRDLENRNLIEHAILSGRDQLFETVFHVARLDIFDEELDLMMDPDENAIRKQSAMKAVLRSPGGRMPIMEKKVALTTKHLKRDVTLRASSSTVTSKIQGFIPGNLIIIFQLVGAEFGTNSDAQVILLLLLCVIAPVWAFGAGMMVSTDPQQQRTQPRKTVWSYLLAFPAMFFWGIGTSTVAMHWGWDETASATSLAVATIILPALDSFLSGRSAQSKVSKAYIQCLEYYDWMIDKFCVCKSRRALEGEVATVLSMGSTSKTWTEGVSAVAQLVRDNDASEKVATAKRESLRSLQRALHNPDELLPPGASNAWVGRAGAFRRELNKRDDVLPSTMSNSWTESMSTMKRATAAASMAADDAFPRSTSMGAMQQSTMADTAKLRATFTGQGMNSLAHAMGDEAASMGAAVRRQSLGALGQTIQDEAAHMGAEGRLQSMGALNRVVRSGGAGASAFVHELVGGMNAVEAARGHLDNANISSGSTSDPSTPSISISALEQAARVEGVSPAVGNTILTQVLNALQVATPTAHNGEVSVSIGSDTRTIDVRALEQAARVAGVSPSATAVSRTMRRASSRTSSSSNSISSASTPRMATERMALDGGREQKHEEV